MSSVRLRCPQAIVIFAACVVVGLQAVSAQESSESGADLISFARDVRPILAARCFGCHQSARSQSGYVMTDFDAMLAGGDSGLTAIAPHDPDGSYLLELIELVDGSAQMPPAGEGEPVSAEDVATIRRWIEQGAVSDYASSVLFSPESPPEYHHPPVLTSLDVSPDGKWLAISAFQEVLLVAVDELAPVDQGGPLPIARRLVGMSPRIESVRFSPDGSRLAVGGGNPGESGELQIWDMVDGQLQHSLLVGDDTIDGVNWSPDGSLVSFGCKDNTLRVIRADSGEQVLYQGAHEDWIRDTVFSTDGSQLVSVGRDMTCKLIEVPTQRFIDNITSITPGVLKGGISSVARHPERDEVVIGGSDGIVKVYRMNRITKRVIGDDANLVRLMPEMPGRIQAVSVSGDGTQIAAVSSLDGRGYVRVFSYDFDPAVSEELKAILAKQPSQWSADERKRVNAYNTDGVHQTAAVDVPESALYSIAFLNGGQQVVCGGADGNLRIIDVGTGAMLANRPSITVAAVARHEEDQLQRWLFEPDSRDVVEVAGFGSAQPVSHRTVSPFVALDVLPARLAFRSPIDYAQLVVMATRDDGTRLDVTDAVDFEYDASRVAITAGLVQPLSDGETALELSLDGVRTSVPISIEMPDAPFVPDFRRDINPVMTRLGCNAGTCHGSAGGKQGFKLSLRGYDPQSDLRALTDDMGSRRVNHAWPAQSLMVRKPAGVVAHAGGQLITPDSRYEHLLREWIAGGSRMDWEKPIVQSIELQPSNPILADAGAVQTFRVVATFADGTTRDVTRESFIEVGNTEVASVARERVTATRRGETPVLVRYEGAYTATTLTVMGDRSGFVWQEPESWGEIDDHVAAKWLRMKIVPADLCSDEEFLRRVYLDLTGLPPSAETVTAFVADARPVREKRDAVIDSLIGNEEFVEHWTNKWADLLQINRKYLGVEGAAAFRAWIRDQVAGNRPYDVLVREILTAEGSNKTSPPASYFKIHRTPVDTMENTTHLFLATRFNCNKCHDHPFERWTQDQYFETAAWFSEVALERDPASGDRRIGGSAVEGAVPLYEVVTDKGSGSLVHDRTGQEVSPRFPFEAEHAVAEEATRREELAAWITSPDNPYFATSYVNRLWGYLTGTGLIEPLDDIRAGNPPTNPELLEYLTREFVESGFDTRHVIRLICSSRVYQLSIETNPFNADDTINYSHAKARRLPAEVLFDSIHRVTGSPLRIPGVPEGTRAAALPDAGVSLPSGFLSTLGRPPRESVCECERGSELQLTSVLAMVSGPDVERAISNPENSIAALVSSQSDDRALIESLYLRILNRLPTEPEIAATLDEWQSIPADHQALIEQRDRHQAIVAAALPDLEQQRQAEIAATTAALNARIAEVDPSLLEKEAAREKAIADAETALTDYQSGNRGLDDWMKRQLEQVDWVPLEATGFQSEVGRTQRTETDRSIRVLDDEGKTRGADVYTVTFATDVSGITAVRLEMLDDETLPSRGPGLAENGNYVLSELQMEIAHPDRPDQWQPVELASAVAYFEQAGFPVANAIDGKIDAGSGGWAQSGLLGAPNWAVFHLKIPTGFASGSRLRFRLHQNYDDRHQVGRFRFSLTAHEQAVGLGLDERRLTALRDADGVLDDSTRAVVESAFRKSDARYAELVQALEQARVPLEIDAEVVRLREKLDRVSQPLPPDPLLVRLNDDVETSARQLEQRRLTAAQDLAWALINSPAFLFNH